MSPDGMFTVVTPPNGSMHRDQERRITDPEDQQFAQPNNKNSR